MARRSAPEVNAGSMADIAFLLLIFFLVTTTIESDKVISRRLPPIQEDQQTEVHKEKNVFKIIVNKGGDLLVQDNPMKFDDLRDAVEDFIDNGGGSGKQACSYCQGSRDPDSSENPKKALVSLTYDRQTKFGIYMAVQNELLAAYNDVRNRLSRGLFGEDYTTMTQELKKTSDEGEKKNLKKKIKKVRELYPLNISEAKPEEVQ